jgi:hypothetical protein
MDRQAVQDAACRRIGGRGLTGDEQSGKSPGTTNWLHFFHNFEPTGWTRDESSFKGH